jgi:hypothetical protein
MEETKPTEPKSEIEKALEVADKIEKANKAHKDLLDRQEKMIASQIIGGRTTGAAQVEKPVEESPADYAKRALQGKIPYKK